MQEEQHQQEPYFLRAKLLEAVDADYNVRDMPLILEVLGKLEVLHVSKEILESTRLGKTVNEFRRKVKDHVLARRLKDLVKKWRDAVLVFDTPPNHLPVNGTSSLVLDGGPAGLGGNRGFPPNFGSGYTSASSSPKLVSSSSRVSPAGSYNSNSLSPRILIATNHINNTSVHSIPASRNGSSSIASRSPNNHASLQVSSNSYATLVSPSASSASPLLNSRNLVSPHKSRSPGGPTLSAFHSVNSNLSPLPSSHFQSTISSYAPNAETVSRTHAANKRYRELDDSPSNNSSEPPSKKSRSTVNGTLDDPNALDDISRDSNASRGSDHSDGFMSKDNRFSLSAPSPATPGQVSVLSPQMPIPGTDSNVPSPATQLEIEAATISQAEMQSKKRRRKKQNEFQADTDAIREKIAQAQAEKAAKEAREFEMQRREMEAASFPTNSDGGVPEDRYANNAVVEGYLKSQNILRAKMEREAVNMLSPSDFQGAEKEPVANKLDTTSGKVSKKDKKKHKKKHGGEEVADTTNANSFPSEMEILAQLPPVDPEILKEFANFEYDVNPSPLQPSDDSDTINPYNKETENTTNLKSLSTLEEKPRKLIDWGDSDDEDDEEKRIIEEQADIIAQQVQVISEYTVEDDIEPVTTVVISTDSDVTDHQEKQDQLATPMNREIAEEDVEKYIKNNIPNLNGNFDREGQFREWHETLTIESYKSEPLHILPYTIIDF